jgi:hypothetical protein
VSVEDDEAEVFIDDDASCFALPAPPAYIQDQR